MFSRYPASFVAVDSLPGGWHPISPFSETRAIMSKHDEQSKTRTPEQQPKKPVPSKDIELDVQELEEKIAPVKIY